MSRAGFWAIDPTRKIHFGKDGRWYANDERIRNPRINKLFSTCLRPTSDGGFEIVLGRDRAAVEIEDTPYVVTRVSGDARQGLTLRLNDDSEEALAPDTLSVGPGDVLYCRVKNRRFAARFLRPAYYQIAAYVREEVGEDADGTGFALQMGGAVHPIRRLAADRGTD